MNSVLKRFLKYVQIYTTSKEGVEQIPSTARQFDLANVLVEELKDMGINDANVDEHCIVTATVSSNITQDFKSNQGKQSKKVPVICFIAHLDTSPAELGNNIKPRVINYGGGDISLPNNPDLKINAEEIFPSVEFLKEDDRIVTTDGTTLLGADDKAGIAEIMTAVSKLSSSPDVKHGKIKILFTPDDVKHRKRMF
ncbi:MAG: hypothetical protein ACTSWY_06350 [Promethearchaeota archaeon]